jgi:hypothetical protein
MSGRTRLRSAWRAMAILAAAGTAVACSTPAAAPPPGAFSTTAPVLPTAIPTIWPTPSPMPRPSPPGMASVGEYLHAVQLAVHDHLRVWIETELTSRWLAGPASFRAGIQRVAFLANRPGVAGIKIADELGYQDGLTTPAQIRRFLLDTARALHAAAPHKLILVDVVLPQLGCLPGHQPAGSVAAACAAQAQKAYPQLALPEIGSYLRLHAINVLDVSTGLLTSGQYASMGTTINAAQTAAWQEMKRLGWARLVTLQARKALAHPGKFPGTLGQAEADMHTYVDIPLSAGADAVDIWTWHQEYEGAMYRLLNPGLKPNTLWTALEQQHRAHDVLFTHMSPTSVEGGLQKDLAMIATVFSDVFLPGGTG